MSKGLVDKEVSRYVGLLERSIPLPFISSIHPITRVGRCVCWHIGGMEIKNEEKLTKFENTILVD